MSFAKRDHAQLSHSQTTMNLLNSVPRFSGALLLLLAVVPSTRVNAFSSVAAPNAAATKSSATENQLFTLAEEYVTSKNGFYAPVDWEAHADDFIFRAGVVGPLNKRDYLSTMEKLAIAETFDMQPNAFGFCLDPDDDRTVRFFVRYTGQQVKPWKVAGTPIDIPVTNRPIQGPTEAFCLKFNDQNQVQFFTISNPILYGNPKQPTTGPLGAVLGLFHHVGQPLLADAALNGNVRKLNVLLGDLLPEEVAPPKTASAPEHIPMWWQGY